MRGWKLYPNKTQAEVPPEVSPLPILWKELYFLLGIGKPWVNQHTEWTVPRWIGNKRKQWKENMSLSLLHIEVGHPSCLPLQAPTGQNCLMSPSASTFSEENHHGRTLMESWAETRPCFRLQVTSPKLKLAHQRQSFQPLQSSGSRVWKPHMWMFRVEDKLRAPTSSTFDQKLPTNIQLSNLSFPFALWILTNSNLQDTKNNNELTQGLPWWSRGYESTSRCRRGSWIPGWWTKIPHAAKQLSPCSTITEPAQHS